MRIASWNINNVKLRLPLLLAWLETTRPDIVALQELKTVSEGFPRAEIERAGYGSLVVGQKTWNGVALLARGAEPIPIRRALPDHAGNADGTARYVEAAIEGLIVASIYAPNGNPQPGPKFDQKLAWQERLSEHAKELHASGHPIVLAGDYNVVPSALDIYPSTTWGDNALVQPKPRAWFKRLLEQGWIDAVRTMHPRDPMYTFWDHRRNRWARDAGLRIDHLLLSASLGSRLVDAGVDRAVRGIEGASDHAPVWAEIAAPDV
jgi:exodeoxyribonuclease III